MPVGPQDTTGSLYFDTLFPLGLETLDQALDLIRAGGAPAIPQDERLATYEPICRDEHARLDFTKPAQALYNLVRGCDPQPGAWTTVTGKPLRLFDAVLEDAQPGAAPGTITSIDGAGMRLALDGAAMLVRRVRLDPITKKVPPAELAATGALTVSTRLGN